MANRNFAQKTFVLVLKTHQYFKRQISRVLAGLNKKRYAVCCFRKCSSCKVLFYRL